MSNQPEALRLAEFYEALAEEPPKSPDNSNIRAAAAELRRLSAENESLRQIVQDFPPVEAELREVSDRAHRLETQRDALLEALRAIVHAAMVHACHHALSVDGQQFYDIARAAIKAVEEGK